MSYATKFLEKRYSSLIVSMFPGGWVPDSVVLEGMFLINTAPLVTHCLMKDYAKFLVRRFAVPHVAKGVEEVHIVFDRPLSRAAEMPSIQCPLTMSITCLVTVLVFPRGGVSI